MKGALLVALVTLLVAACGGGDSSQAPTTQEPAATSDGELPAIVVESPAAHAIVSSPVSVSGTANVFEANVTVIVKDVDGQEIARDFTTATCGTGCRGGYSIELPFAVDERQPGTIVVQDDDAAGTGTPPNVVQVPVTLEP